MARVAKETMELELAATLRRFEAEMTRARVIADRRLTEVERRAQQADRNLSRIMARAGQNMTTSFRDSLRGLAPQLAAVFSTAQVLRYADSYTALQNRLRAAGLEGESLARVERELYDISNRYGVAVAASAELFQRASIARESLAASDETLLRIVRGTAAALLVQGTSAEAASGALLQLGQLMAGNVVQAQEYNSLIDQLPVLLQAVASGSARWGGSLARLTADVKKGKVPVREFVDAMLRGFADIEQQAERATMTMGQALQTLNNQLGRYVGQSDSSLSATERMAAAIVLLADNLDLVVTAGGVAVTLIGGRMVLAFGAATIEGLRYQATLLSMAAAQANVSRTALMASSAIAGLRTAAMFFLTNPIGIAITAVAAALALVAVRANDSNVAMAELNQTIAGHTRELDQLAVAAAEAREATGDLSQAATEAQQFIAGLTGEVDLLTTAYGRLAANAKAAAIEMARTRMMATGDALVAAEEAVRRDRLARTNRALIASRDRPLSGAFVDAAQAHDESAAVRALRVARENHERAQRIYEEELARSLASFAPPGGDTPTVRPPGGGSGSGPTPEELAAMRARIRLEMDLEVARARGDQAAIRALEERLDLMRLADELRRAEVANAEEEARAHLARRNAATQAADAERLARENAVLTQRLQAEAAEENLRWAERQLAVQLDMARLAGDWTAVRRLERELDLRRRITEYVERYGIAGYGMAIAEQGMADDAETEGRIRREMRGAAGAFLDALREGDMASFFDAMGRRFADAAADSLTDVLMNIIKSMRSGEGGGWFQSLGDAIWRAFGGARASGGPVQAGKAYIVGERRPELFVPGRDGVIIPQVPTGRGGGTKVEIHNHGAPVAAQVRPTADGVAVDLRPLMREGLKAMGAEGTLTRAARAAPQGKLRG